MSKTALFQLLAATLALGTTASAAPPAQTPRTTTAHEKIRYLTFLPKTYSAKGESVPLIVFLHGSGERGNDLNKVKAWGPPGSPKRIRPFRSWWCRRK